MFGNTNCKEVKIPVAARTPIVTKGKRSDRTSAIYSGHRHCVPSMSDMGIHHVSDIQPFSVGTSFFGSSKTNISGFLGHRIIVARRYDLASLSELV